MTKKKMKKKKIILKVRSSKKTNQKTVTIPKSAKHIRKGDYITIRRVN